MPRTWIRLRSLLMQSGQYCIGSPVEVVSNHDPQRRT